MSIEEIKEECSQGDTPETNAAIWVDEFREECINANFARKLERERDAAQEKLSTVYQWIERHHQDGFTDSMTYWQNLEKIGDKYSDRIDDAERQLDAAREDAERLASELQQALRQWASYADQYEEQDLEKSSHTEGEWYRIAKQALAAHEALNHKTERL